MLLMLFQKQLLAIICFAVVMIILLIVLLSLIRLCLAPHAPRPLTACGSHLPRTLTRAALP